MHKGRGGPPDQRRELDVLRCGGGQREEASGGPAGNRLEHVHVALAAAAELLGAAAHLEPPRLEVGLSGAARHGGEFARRCHGTHAARGAEAASQEPRSGAPSLSALPPCRAASPLHRRDSGAPCGGQLPLAVAAAHMVRHACQLDRSRGQRRDGGRGAGCDVGRGGRRGGRRGLGEKAEGARLGVSQPRGAHLRPSGWRRGLATGAGDGWRSGLAMG